MNNQFNGLTHFLQSGSSEIMGCGVLLDERRVITCYHVLRDVYGQQPIQQGNLFTVNLPNLGLVNVTLKLIDFKPENNTANRKDLEDLAILETLEPLQLFNQLPPIDLRSEVPIGSQIKIYSSQSKNFVDASYQGDAHNGWMVFDQITQKKLKPGDSGSPIWSEQSQAIIGLVVAKNGTDTSYGLPGKNFAGAFNLPISFRIQPKKQQTLCPSHTVDTVAKVDRVDHWDGHIERRLKQDSANTMAFVVCGVMEEWPQALEFRLRRFLNLNESKTIEPSLYSNNPNEAEQAFWQAIWQKLRHDISDTSPNQQQIAQELAQSNSNQLFFWDLRSDVKSHLETELISHLVQQWESLVIPNSRHRFCLFIQHGFVDSAGLFGLGSRKVEQWRRAILQRLDPAIPQQQAYLRRVIDPLTSPTREHINNWITTLNETQQPRVYQALKPLGKKVPHRKICEVYTNLFTANKDDHD